VRYLGEQKGVIVATSRAAATSAREGPLRYDSIFQGELFDARREQPGWASPVGLNRTTGWSLAVRMRPNVSAVMRSALIQPIRPSEKFEALRVDVLTNPGTGGTRTGSIIYDFGQNLAGYCSHGPLSHYAMIFISTCQKTAVIVCIFEHVWMRAVT
jgi:hypothetical protein